MAESIAKRIVQNQVWQYWQGFREVLSSSTVPKVSCAVDGTRVEGKDTLYAALWSLAKEVGGRAPPVAPDLPLPWRGSRGL
eukprot:11178487-Lingulodinium_polyedra.AAC.1